MIVKTKEAKDIKTKVSFSVFSLIWLAILLYLDTSLVLPMLLAVMLHECGHICGAVFLKRKIKKVKFLLTGASMELVSPFLSYKEEFILAMAGPAFGLIGFALCYPLYDIFYNMVFFSKLMYYFSLISLCLSVFNLIPIRSFDGGRMLYCVSAKIFGIKSAERLINITTFLCIFSLWCLSAYLMLKTLSGVTLFIFSAILFIRFFIKGSVKE